ncbi:MAG: phosphodiester glycosidase family protein [Candidatus Roizmanbacteria bacterium]|nr:phosphodiester glycosidase family protein [Candidatus Roizmanbacteria bacterium]
MKKILLIVLIAYIFIVFYVLKSNITKSIESDSGSKNAIVVTEPVLPTVIHGAIQYSYILFHGSENAVVIQNTEQEDFAAITERLACQYAINGNFYTTDYKPIGLVQINGTLVSSQIESVFFDGYLSIDTKAHGEIGLEPDYEMANVLQSGPLLIKNGEISSLTVQEDKQSRRSIALTTDTKDLYFVSVFKNDSRFSGPYLEDLPEIIAQIAEKEHINVVWALNLDGGSASAIKTPNRLLPEFKIVETVICFQ